MSERGLSISAVAEIRVDSTKELAEIIENSLKPEVQDPVSTRSKVEVVAEDDIIRINIAASDLSALRAALNSYLRWVDSILEVVEKVSKLKE